MSTSFERYDATKDGRIDQPEYYSVNYNLARTVRHLNGPSETDSHLQQKLLDPVQSESDFYNLDDNKDGYLTFDEFTGKACATKRDLLRALIRALLNA